MEKPAQIHRRFDQKLCEETIRMTVTCGPVLISAHCRDLHQLARPKAVCFFLKGFYVAHTEISGDPDSEFLPRVFWNSTRCDCTDTATQGANNVREQNEITFKLSFLLPACWAAWCCTWWGFLTSPVVTAHHTRVPHVGRGRISRLAIRKWYVTKPAVSIQLQ